MYTVEEIIREIETEGKEHAFWMVFDAYYQIVSTPAWDAAYEKLPEQIQTLVDQHGLDSNLDWDYWEQSSFFGLSYDFSNEILDEFRESHYQEYKDFLNAVETAMWAYTQAHDDFHTFCQALNRAYKEERV